MAGEPGLREAWPGWVGNHAITRVRRRGMKKHVLSLALLISVAACGGAVVDVPADQLVSNGGLAMCAPGVPDCVDVVVEPAPIIGYQPIEPVGNSQNPVLYPGPDLLSVSEDGLVLQFGLTMGVEPCDVIDRVEVIETADSVDVEIWRGVGDVAATCIALAESRSLNVVLDAPLGNRTLTVGGLPAA